MSLLTGQPRGRVTFVKDGGDTIIVLTRGRVEKIEKQADYWIKWEEHSRREHREVYIGRDRDAVFNSIVSEDSDVVWTSAGVLNWIRVPDLQEPRTDRPLPAPTTLPGPGETRE